jgi:hypothetical protein
MAERVHAWSSANDGMPKHRHGRAHVVLHAAGTRGHPAGTGPRRDLSLGAEWRLLVPRGKSFGLGAQLTWGTNASETTPDLSIHLSRLGDLWLQLGGVIPYTWLERHKPNGDVDYDTRIFEVTVAREHFSWSWWARRDTWSRRDPWWMHQYHRWDALFLGRTDVDHEIVETGPCVVPMPETTYPAQYRIERITHRHRRAFGRFRDRLLGRRSWLRTEIRPGTPIPVPGKGENSWDMDDDAIHSMSVAGASVENAVGQLVIDALRTRARYGGQHMSVPA